MAEQRSNRPIVTSTVPPSNRTSNVPLPRMSSLPPPRELEELDDGWGDEDAQPAALAPPRAPDLALATSPAVLPAVTANPPVAEHQRAELEELRLALADVQRALAKARDRIRLLESQNAAAEAELGAARTAQHELGQQLEAARAAQLELRRQLEGARATAASGDDLRAIKGIGPKLSKKLQEIGISSYAELAALDAEGVATLAELLGVPKSRIERNGWVEAARQLAADTNG
jgi:predicted flap endonuclease-1-like 5' DNA nuclease